ncbi:MAG: tetratricopeptide repeat protein [Bacteroidetes bacterium]|nr:tetratricopeptide repeat protein [Bacteroidota bacterium]
MQPVNFPYLAPTKPLGGRERVDKILEQIPLHPEDALKLYHELAYASFAGIDHEVCKKACDYLIEHAKDKNQLCSGNYLKAEVLASVDQKFHEAIPYYRKAVELEPDADTILLNFASCLEKVGKLDEALKCYHEVEKISLEEENESDWVYVEMAEVYFKKGENENAKKYFQKALDLEPENTEALCGLGRVAATVDDYDGAMNYFEQALKLQPEDAYIFYYIAHTWSLRDDFYRAMHFYTEALKRKPDFAEVYNNIGSLYYNHEGDLKTALDNMLKALEIIGERDEKILSMVYLNISKLYRQISEYDLADTYKTKFWESMGFPGNMDDAGEDEDEGDEALN